MFSIKRKGQFFLTRLHCIQVLVEIQRPLQNIKHCIQALHTEIIDFINIK